ncbi:MAG: hypothetical protein Q8K75_08385 [Chlamydiales bacterium]|nr:hypothetical protein [Chlamydiales bacterium]
MGAQKQNDKTYQNKGNCQGDSCGSHPQDQKHHQQQKGQFQEHVNQPQQQSKNKPNTANQQPKQPTHR